VYGCLFLAILCNRTEEVAKYRALMQKLIPSGGLEQTAIAKHVFAQLISLRFSSDQPVREISEFVAAARGVMTHPELIGRLEAEALIRHALGEETVFVDDISYVQQSNVYSALSIRVILEQRLPEESVARLVVQAEKWAQARGIKLVPLR
jgi:hypothetical protein